MFTEGAKEAIYRIRQEIPQVPTLLEFVFFSIGLIFLFPSLNSDYLKNRNLFIKVLKQDKKPKEIDRLLELMPIEISEGCLAYLSQSSDWWVIFQELSLKNKLDHHDLAVLHENIRLSSQKKRLGSYHTPKSLIQKVCRTSLFTYLVSLDGFPLDGRTTYNLVFKGKYPSNLDNDVYKQIMDVLSAVKVLDPSCGIGLFIIEMNNLIIELLQKNPANRKSSKKSIFLIKKVLLNTYGCDIDPVSIYLSRITLYKIYLEIIKKENSSETTLSSTLFSDQLQVRNFIRDDISNQFDICVTNPPYVRHHGLKSKIDLTNNMARLSKDLHFWDKKADLYIYFWLKIISLLVDNGTLGLVVSRSWLSSRFSQPLINRFLDDFQLVMILETPYEPWQHAQVKTHIVIGRKIRSNVENRPLQTIILKENDENAFVDIPILISSLFPTKPLADEFIWKDDGLTIRGYETPAFRSTYISDAGRIIRRKIFPLSRLDYLEMAPLLLIKVLLRNQDKFCMLEELGDVKMGSTTGANKFFYLSSKTVKDFNIPDKFLKIMTKSPREWDDIFGPYPKRLKHLLYLSVESFDLESAPVGHPVKQYLTEIQEKVLSRPYFRNKSKTAWYRVPLLQPDLVLPNMIYKRSFVGLNARKYHIDKQWIGFWSSKRDWTLILLAFFNSTLGILLRETLGTKTLGLGALKISLQEWRHMLVLDPRPIMKSSIFPSLVSAVQRLKNVEIPAIAAEGPFGRIRTVIDNLILREYLDLSNEDIFNLSDTLKLEYGWRTHRKGPS
ncbi:MAG: Eco57I restriction-modification methylase domain-containing protein [Candidatus Thorarchaeota archaeon]